MYLRPWEKLILVVLGVVLLACQAPAPNVNTPTSSAPAAEALLAILDMVGGHYIPRQLERLAPEGRLGFVELMQGSRVEADFGLIQRKHMTVTGSTLRPRSIEEKAAIIAALKEKVWPLWATGKMRVFTYQKFSLTEAVEAHRLMDSSRHIGKILLVL